MATMASNFFIGGGDPSAPTPSPFRDTDEMTEVASEVGGDDEQEEGTGSGFGGFLRKIGVSAAYVGLTIGASLGAGLGSAVGAGVGSALGSFVSAASDAAKRAHSRTRSALPAQAEHRVTLPLAETESPGSLGSPTLSGLPAIEDTPRRTCVDDVAFGTCMEQDTARRPCEDEVDLGTSMEQDTPCRPCEDKVAVGTCMEQDFSMQTIPDPVQEKAACQTPGRPSLGSTAAPESESESTPASKLSPSSPVQEETITEPGTRHPPPSPPVKPALPALEADAEPSATQPPPSPPLKAGLPALEADAEPRAREPPPSPPVKAGLPALEDMVLTTPMPACLPTSESASSSSSWTPGPGESFPFSQHPKPVQQALEDTPRKGQQSTSLSVTSTAKKAHSRSAASGAKKNWFHSMMAVSVPRQPKRMGEDMIVPQAPPGMTYDGVSKCIKRVRLRMELREGEWCAASRDWLVHALLGGRLPQRRSAPNLAAVTPPWRLQLMIKDGAVEPAEEVEEEKEEAATLPVKRRRTTTAKKVDQQQEDVPSPVVAAAESKAASAWHRGPSGRLRRHSSGSQADRPPVALFQSPPGPTCAPPAPSSSRDFAEDGCELAAVSGPLTPATRKRWRSLSSDLSCGLTPAGCAITPLSEMAPQTCTSVVMPEDDWTVRPLAREWQREKELMRRRVQKWKQAVEEQRARDKARFQQQAEKALATALATQRERHASFWQEWKVRVDQARRVERARWKNEAEEAKRKVRELEDANKRLEHELKYLKRRRLDDTEGLTEHKGPAMNFCSPAAGLLQTPVSCTPDRG